MSQSEEHQHNSTEPYLFDSREPFPFVDEKPGSVRIVDEIPEGYLTSSRRLLSSITQILVILAILVLLPWAIRIYDVVVAANDVSEETLAAVDTTNSLLMFQICSQLAGVRSRRIKIRYWSLSANSKSRLLRQP
jgi:hypothetical protein